MDDNVEVAPIYRCDGKATQHTGPCKNHGLAIEHLPTWTESHLTLKDSCKLMTPYMTSPTAQTGDDIKLSLDNVSLTDILQLEENLMLLPELTPDKVMKLQKK